MIQPPANEQEKTSRADECAHYEHLVRVRRILDRLRGKCLAIHARLGILS